MLEHLWILRHGLAADQFDTDFNRALSEKGETQVKSSIRQLIETEKTLPLDMLVSPFKRTLSTANITYDMLPMQKPYKTDEMLVHFADHKILGDYLLASGYKNLIIVSHMPIVARLCQYLSPNCDIFGFETAQLVRLDFDNNDKSSSFATVGNTIVPRI